MYRLRHHVFIDRLKWDVGSSGGLERDQFDNENTVYLVLRNAFNEVIGSVRMLPTVGPNVLCDIFPNLAEDGDPPRSPTVWEASRLAIDDRKEKLEAVRRPVNIIGTLLSAIIEFSMEIGLSHVVSVSDARLERIIKRAGWMPERLGPGSEAEGYPIYGEKFEVSPRWLSSVRKKGRIAQSVLMTEDYFPTRRAA